MTALPALTCQSGEIMQLEQRYIQLLEQRVRNLELAVNDGSKTTDEEQASTNGLDSEGNKTHSNGTAQAEGHIEEKRRSRVYKEVRFVTDKGDDEKKIEHPEQYTIIFREIHNSKSNTRDVRCEIDIRGASVREMLKTAIKEYPGQSWEGTIVTIPSPFMPLIHNWASLEEVASTAVPNDDEEQRLARQDLAILLEHIQAAPELANFFKLRESYLDAKITTWETMWSLFVPGNLVIAKPFMDIAQIFTIHTAPFQWFKHTIEDSPATLRCWCYEWNGKKVAHYNIPIEHFQGTKPITELPCYPLEYFTSDGSYEDREDLFTKLALRGSRYNAIARKPNGISQMFEYAGEALAGKRNTLGKDGEDDKYTATSPRRILWDILSSSRREAQKTPAKTVTMKGKVIIDARAFLDYGAATIVLGELAARTTDGKSIGNEEVIDQAVLTKLNSGVLCVEDLTNAERGYLALFPPRLLGYATHDKFWGQFSVESLKTVGEPNEDAFIVKLQLDDEYKDMIGALVKTHGAKSRNTERQMVTDIIEGKGQGLVILLHGPPGVGKTLTAETIAEATGKPLLIVSVAEIGLNTASAERNLESMFALASAWEAILLIDEADVFLENRSSEYGTERNALVSVLLRALEYYHGIMILTTNRINTLDVAVQSRIHLAIRYEDLKKAQKSKIFKYYLDQIGSQNRQRDAIDAWIDEAGADAEVNGRQIRNIVSAAWALACNAKEDISKEHLKKVMKVSKDFTNDLQRTTKAVRDHNEAGRMR